MPDQAVNIMESSRHPHSQDDQPHGGRLFRAASLKARRGAYSEASELLGQARAAGDCSAAEALDLQARICAQQGMLLRAEACWIEALRLDPGNTTYVDAIARLRRASSPVSKVRAGLFALAGIAGVAVCIWSVWIGYNRMAGRMTRIESTLSELRAAQTNTQASTTSRLDALDTEVRQGRSDTVAAIAALPTTRSVDDHFRKLSSANAAATTQVAADMRHQGELLTAQRKEDHEAVVNLLREHSDALAKQLAKAQSDLAAAVKASHERQIQSTKELTAALDRQAATVVELKAGTIAGMDAFERRMGKSLLELRDEIDSIRQEIGRFLWFRLPATSRGPRTQDGAPLVPATSPGSAGEDPR